MRPALWLFVLLSAFSARAAELSWCMNNGFLAQVPQCSADTHWAFDVTATLPFKALLAAGVASTCNTSRGEQPCSLVGGLDSAGHLNCATNSTTDCTSAGQARGHENLAAVFKDCAAGSKTVKRGSATLDCVKLKNAYNAQLSQMSSTCGLTAKELRQSCENSRQALVSVTQPQTAVVTPAPGPAPKYTTQELNCRMTPIPEGLKLGTFVGGATVIVRGPPRSDGWTPVICPDGSNGFVNSKYLSDQNRPVVTDSSSSSAQCTTGGPEPADARASSPLSGTVHKITWLGDSQTAYKDGIGNKVFQDLKAKGVILNNGKAVCGAPISGYTGTTYSSACKWKEKDKATGKVIAIHDVTDMSVAGGEMKFKERQGQTTDAANLMAGSDTVIVQLGDNNHSDADFGYSAAVVLAKKILTAGKDCVWIGPASIQCECDSDGDGIKDAKSWNKKRQISVALKKAMADTVVSGRSCRFVNSFELTREKPPYSYDCLHYTTEGGYDDWHSAIKSEVLRVLGLGGGSADKGSPDADR